MEAAKLTIAQQLANQLIEMIGNMIATAVQNKIYVSKMKENIAIKEALNALGIDIDVTVIYGGKLMACNKIVFTNDVGVRICVEAVKVANKLLKSKGINVQLNPAEICSKG